MDTGLYLTACSDDDGASVAGGDRACVPWWSFSKTVLAVAALKLVASGRLALDARIDGRPYTLRQLLQHRAGLPDYGGLAAYHEAVRRRDSPWSADELRTRVAADRLEFEPGCGWVYSNVGYLLVRRLIEQASGRDLGSALRHLVFDPLDLKSVRLASTVDEFADTAWGNRDGYDPGWVYHGCLVGTPADAVRLLDRLMAGAVLPADMLAEMMRAHPLGGPLPGRPWRTTGYGLGLMIGDLETAGTAVGHTGGGPGSVAAVYHFPDRARTVAAFAAGEDGGAVEFEIVRLVGGR